MRAAAADGPTASLMGIRLSRTGATGWALAGVLAALAGIFLTSFPAPGVAPTVALSAFLAIPAWVLGGFDSVPGAVLGGLIIGLVTALTVGYESDLHLPRQRVRRGRALRRHDHRPAGAARRACSAARRPSVSDLPRRIGLLVLLLVALGAAASCSTDFWLQLGLFVMAAMVGAVGLTLLVGVAGQLSLGHAAFAAIGAYVYVWATSESTPTLAGAGLPAVVGLVLAVGVAALVGFVFSPVASRLRGIYLGLATLGLVFLVRHLLLNLEAWTGGFTGRAVEPFTLGGFSFSNRDPDFLAVAGVEFEGLHRLWYLFLVLTLLACWLAANLRSSRTGRAWANVRDSETAAAAMGIAVARQQGLGLRRVLRLRRAHGGAARARLQPARPRRLQPHRCRSTSW